MDSSEANQHASKGKGDSRKTWLRCKRDGKDSACGVLVGAVKRESMITKYGGQRCWMRASTYVIYNNRIQPVWSRYGYEGNSYALHSTTRSRWKGKVLTFWLEYSDPLWIESIFHGEMTI